MNSQATGVLALDIGGTKLAAAIGDESGELRNRRIEPTLPDAGAEIALKRAIALARAVLDDEQASGGVVTALGVATMGITREHGTELAPNVPGWDKLAIPPVLAEAFPELEITIENDVRAATLAELAWGALAGVRTGVYLNLGTGTSAGIVIGGTLFAGAHGASGEIGYALTPGWQHRRLAAEGGVPSEELLGGRGLRQRTVERLGNELDLPGLLALAATDAQAAAVVEELWDGIAAMAANLAITIDPEVLVLGGGYLRSESSLASRVASVVQRAAPFPPRVVVSRYTGDASLYGAAALSTLRKHASGVGGVQ